MLRLVEFSSVEDLAMKLIAVEELPTINTPLRSTIDDRQDCFDPVGWDLPIIFAIVYLRINFV